MKKKIVAMIVVAAMALSLAACGSSQNASQSGQGNAGAAPSAAEEQTGNAGADADKVYHVGVCQLTEHAALDAATQGFIDTLKDKLGDKVEIENQNAQGEQANCATICTGYVSDNVDLIMANATPALQAATAATADIPILGTSVTDYATALNLKDMSGATGMNVSGTADLAPIADQEAMIKELFPNAKQVGILYCSAEPNSKYQADQMIESLEADKIAYKTYTAADTNEIQSVVTKACDECDVLYIPTDNTMANGIDVVKNIIIPKKIPMVAGEAGICAAGVATLSIDYYDLGCQTGEMAYEILVNGADVSTMDIRYPEKVSKMYNKANCDELQVTVPEGYEELPAE